ncbi:hypothetical protein EST38_g5921 [Candolleomyces aberdarensis]|uniref:Uncharacterized protein n=1 Tax=Candolleomyces aberdarensis TaxID=2316362 RepID=A0A4Q2DLA6_9AGAR|nr:hypothetical protein EST38_g5921 [Candolleomyces aberdarensis]
MPQELEGVDNLEMMKSDRIEESTSDAPNFAGRLAPEIWAAIFLAVVDATAQEGSRSLTMSKYHPAVIISHVSQQWRELCLHTPALWKRIYIHIPPYLRPLEVHDPPGAAGLFNRITIWKRQVDRLKELAGTWIARSGNSPLSIIFDEHAAKYPMNSGWIRKPDSFHADMFHLDGLIDLLCRSSSRWNDVYLGLCLTHIDHPTFRLLCVPAQSCPAVLREMHMFIGVEEMYSTEEWQQVFLQATAGGSILNTPTLRSLGIGPMELFSRSASSIVWEDLTDLVLNGSEDVSMIDLVQILLQCRDLRKCELSITAQCFLLRASEDFPGPYVDLPVLEEMTVSIPYHLPPSLSYRLLLPSLRKLTLDDFYGNRTKSLDELDSGIARFFEQFGNQLTYVSLHYLTLTQSALHYCLRHLPNVVHLELLGSSYKIAPEERPVLSGDLMRALTPRFDKSRRFIRDSCLCPGVEEFVCLPSPKTLDEGAFLDFIAARRAGDKSSEDGLGRLRTVSMSLWGYDFKTVDIMVELQKRGAELENFVFLGNGTRLM